jgi:hypothetical protein
MINPIGNSFTTAGLTGIQQASKVPAGADPDGDGDVHGVGRDSAAISGPGKLLSRLQQLQAQDPAKFKQVMTDISGKLQTAAGQATGGQGQFLSGLASQFQAAASSGDLSGLRPQRAHGHHRHGTGTYNPQGRVTPPAAATGTGPTDGADLKQLFAGISQELAQALGG